MRNDDANGDAGEECENSDNDDKDMHDHLPEWFTTDESRHCERQLPVKKKPFALYRGTVEDQQCSADQEDFRGASKKEAEVDE